MYNYELHLNQIPAALRTARRAAVILRDENGNETGSLPAHDYAPAQGWVLILDAGRTHEFHHDETDALLRLLEPEDVYAETGELIALLYKVDPRRPKENVRATKRINSAALTRIEVAIESGELIEARV